MPEYLILRNSLIRPGRNTAAFLDPSPMLSTVRELARLAPKALFILFIKLIHAALFYIITPLARIYLTYASWLVFSRFPPMILFLLILRINPLRLMPPKLVFLISSEKLLDHTGAFPLLLLSETHIFNLKHARCLQCYHNFPSPSFQVDIRKVKGNVALIFPPLLRTSGPWSL